MDETSIREKDDSADGGGGVEPHTKTPALGTALVGVPFGNGVGGGYFLGIGQPRLLSEAVNDLLPAIGHEAFQALCQSGLPLRRGLVCR